MDQIFLAITYYILAYIPLLLVLYFSVHSMSVLLFFLSKMSLASEIVQEQNVYVKLFLLRFVSAT